MPFDTQSMEYDVKLAARPRVAAPIQPRSLSIYRHGAKRLLDITLVILCLPIVLPVIAVLAAIIALDGHNPFYTQLRVGRDGREFRMIKLRTMVPNAHALLAAYLEKNPSAKAEWDATQKLKRDPRITRLGRVLRKCSIDELPQLFNVLLGSMALVGPRPMMVEQKTIYTGTGYYKLRPGLTGFWQISDRNECDFSDRAKFDDAYFQSLSLGTDLTVMLRTVNVVVRGTGY